MKSEGRGALAQPPVHFALLLTGLSFIVTRDAGDTGDCSLGRGAKPLSLASLMSTRGQEATPEGGPVFSLGVCISCPVSFSAGEGGSGTVGPWLGFLLTGSVCFGIGPSLVESPSGILGHPLRAGLA